MGVIPKTNQPKKEKPRPIRSRFFVLRSNKRQKLSIVGALFKHLSPFSVFAIHTMLGRLYPAKEDIQHLAK